jgi:hypothetical protein
MELPPDDYTDFDEAGNPIRVVVRLLRNLYYGSKQAAYMWYNLLTSVLTIGLRIFKIKI